MPALTSFDAGNRTLQNPAFFIVGVPGSGTTVLHQLLDAQPGLAVAPDVREITRYYETRTGLDRDGPIAAALIRKWVQKKRLAAFEVGLEEAMRLIPTDRSLPYKDFVALLLDRYGKVRGKTRVGSRALEYVRLLPDVHALWPEAKIIHLIRDGRDVWLTLAKGQTASARLGRFSAWESDPVATFALWWAWQVRQGREAGRQVGPLHYLEVRYESLRDEPIQVCTRLGAFLGLHLDYSLLPQEPIPDIEADVEAAWVCQSKDWRVHMTSEDATCFEAVAGDLLDELGYSRHPHTRANENLVQATALRDRFQREMVRPRSTSELAKSRRASGRTNPFVFIVGCPRSGTTLLQRILDAHPEVAICPETFWVPYFFKRRIGLTPDGLVTPDLISRLFEYYKFYRMKVEREELINLCASKRLMDYASFASHVYDLFGEARDKPLVGDKTPDYVRNLQTLHGLWPKAKFIHLIRDGRDVALSAINWKRKVDKLASLFRTWREDPVTTAAFWWEWHVSQGREAAARLGPELYYELRYEALVSNPAEECIKLCNSLGIPFHRTMLEFHQGRTRSESGLDAKNAWQPIKAGLRDWRTQMSLADEERFEHAVGDLLADLNYARAAPPPQPEARQPLAAMRATFREDTERLGDWLP